MCGVCGCSGEGAKVTAVFDHESERRRTSGVPHEHDHQHGHDHHHNHDSGAGHDADGLTVNGAQDRWVHVEQDILSKNDGFASINRGRFQMLGILALNLVSSPGAGKTSLLTATAERLREKVRLLVIEGDQETENDARRIRDAGVDAVQINTGRVCHLDAHMIGHALDEFFDPTNSILFIENVGNLVCPAAFDLGEDSKVAILSVTEGEDKPIKYPDMFAASDLMILNKIDLLPYVDFNVEKCVKYARQVNPAIQVLQVSATNGNGLDGWIDWILDAAHTRRRQSHADGAAVHA